MEVSSSSYNITNMPFIENKTPFTTLQITAFVVYALLLCIGAPGNLLIVLRVVLDRKLRSPTFVAISGLAAADFIFLCCRIPLEILHLLFSNWIYGVAVCKLSYFLYQTASYSAAYHLVLLACIRYYLLVHPFSSTVHLTVTKSCIATGVIWGVAVVLLLPVTITSGVVTIEYHGLVYTMCTVNPLDRNSHIVFITCYMIFSYFLPLLLIIALHVIKARAVARATRVLTDDKKRQLYAMVVLVIILFGLLLLPVHVTNLVSLLVTIPPSDSVQAVGLLFRVLAYSNSCVNPVVYAFMSEPFRTSLRRMFGLTQPSSTPATSAFYLSGSSDRTSTMSHTDRESV